MNLVQLSGKDRDVEFLAGVIVQCMVEIPEKLVDTIQPQQLIVVQLSNKSKYKGIITTCEVTATSKLFVTAQLGIRRK